MTGLSVWVPKLPPSSNNIYINHPQGKGRILSSPARAFKIDAMRHIQQKGRVAFLQLKNNVPYQLTLAVFFDQIEYKRSAKGSRYKRIDLSNQIKLIEDTVSEAIGIGDEHNFRLLLEKHCDINNPGIYVRLHEIPEAEVGLTKEQYMFREKLHGEPKGAPNGGESNGASNPVSKFRIPSSSPRFR